MKLAFKSSEFIHIKERSEYNHNYYQYVGNANHKFILYEICHEDYNFQEYWLLEGGTRIFIGCSTDFIYENSIVNIDFREYYT
jgi:hypothetical protein